MKPGVANSQAFKWTPYLGKTKQSIKEIKRLHLPVCVSCTYSESKGTPNIEPKLLSEFASNGSNSHGCQLEFEIVVTEEMVGLRLTNMIISAGPGHKA